MTFINPLAFANAAAQQVASASNKDRTLGRTDRRRNTAQLSEQRESISESADAIVDVSADPDAKDSNRQAPTNGEHRKKKREPPKPPRPEVDFTA